MRVPYGLRVKRIFNAPAARVHAAACRACGKPGPIAFGHNVCGACVARLKAGLTLQKGDAGKSGKSVLFKKSALLAGMLLLCLWIAGCRKEEKQYPLSGQVMGKSMTTGEIVVKHGDIPGFMPAMTMPYKVKDKSVIQEVQIGDKVVAKVSASDERKDYWLDQVVIADESQRGAIKTDVQPHQLLLIA